MMLTFTHKHIEKSQLHVEQFSRNIYGTLTENLETLQRARNPPHNWVEQKEKKIEREKKNQDRTRTILRELLKRKSTQTWERHLTDQEISCDRGTSKCPCRENSSAGLRRAKQSESCTDHLHHCSGHHSLRSSGGGWMGRSGLESVWGED